MAFGRYLLSGMHVWPDNQLGLAVQEATNGCDFDRKEYIHEHWTKLTDHPNWEQYQQDVCRGSPVKRNKESVGHKNRQVL